MTSEVDLFLKYANTIRYDGGPATEAEIVTFERRYHIQFPPDMREFFLKINGTYMPGISIETLSEWCLLTEYMDQWNIEYKYAQNAELYFHFGNYDISVWEWLIILSDDPEASTPVFVWHDEVIKIADSFSDFLRKYRLHGPESLLGYD